MISNANQKCAAKVLRATTIGSHVLRDGKRGVRTGSNSTQQFVRAVLGRVGYVTVANTQVYDSPYRAKIYNVVQPGQKIVLIGYNSQWYGIRMSDGRNGWVWRGAVRLSDTEVRVEPVYSFASPSHPLAGQPTLTVRQIAKLTEPSVATLTVRGSNGTLIATGTGFVIGKNLLVTNAHVIDGAAAVNANYENGRSSVVHGVISQDKVLDLAFLYTNTAGIKPLTLGNSALVGVGDTVVAIGAPEGLSGTVSTGIISAMRKIDGGAKWLQTTTPVSRGSSGGPLLDVKGNVIGVTVASYKEGQNLNFAVPAGYVFQLLKNADFSWKSWDELTDSSNIGNATPNNSIGSVSTP